MKKLLCLLLMATMVLALFPLSGVAEDDLSEEVHLKWIQIGGKPIDMDVVQAAMNEITKEKINATFELTFYDWGEYNDKAGLAISAGEDFDIVFTSSWAASYPLYASQGAFVRLDDPENNLLERYAAGTLALINPAFLTGSKINGGNYALPVNKELGFQSVWNINKNVADKYGIVKEDFTTVEGLEPLLKKVKEGEGEGFYPLNMDMEWLSGNHGQGEGVESVFVVLYDPDNPADTDTKVQIQPKTEEYQNYVRKAREYYLAGYINPDAVTSTNDVGDAMNKSGNWLVGAYHYMPLHELSDSLAKGYPVEVQPIHTPIVATWSTTGAMNAISINSDHPERAMMLLNLVNSDPELRQMLSYGIEGTHYTLDDTGAMVREPAQADLYGPANFALGNVMIVKLMQGDPADKWAQFQAFNDSAVDSPLLGFTLDKDPIANELAAIENIKAEYHKTLCFGAVDPDVALEEYIAKLDAAGVEDLLVKVQAQVDEFLASK